MTMFATEMLTGHQKCEKLEKMYDTKLSVAILLLENIIVAKN